MRPSIAAEQQAAGLKRGVVVDDDVARAVENLEEAAVAPPAADVGKDIVAIVMRLVWRLEWLSS